MLFAKTAAGRNALLTRSIALDKKLRFFLILVNGERDIYELERLFGTSVSTAYCLEFLLANKLIVHIGADGLPKAWSTTANGASFAEILKRKSKTSKKEPSPRVAPIARLTFDNARLQLVEFVNEQLGPYGASLSMQIEACESPEDLFSILPKIREAVAYRSVNAAAIFDEKFIGQSIPVLNSRL